jgi:hypothetical protein
LFTTLYERLAEGWGVDLLIDWWAAELC